MNAINLTAEKLKVKANVLLQNGNLEDAINLYRQAITLDPTYIPAYANLGMSLAAKGFHVEAESVYIAALKIDPNNVDLILNTGIFYARTKQFDKAISILQPIHNNSTKSHDLEILWLVCVYLAISYIETGNFTTALRLLIDIIEFEITVEFDAWSMLEETVKHNCNLNQDDPNLICIAGILSIMSGDPENAEKLFSKAILANEKHPEAYLCLSIAFGEPRQKEPHSDNEKRERLNKAVDALLKTTNLQPEWAEAHYFLGIISLQLKDMESPHRAYFAFQRVLQLASQHDINKYFVKRVETLLNTNHALKAIARL
jgi:tetratricopeptide (TPR) repeat protein